MTYLFKGCLHSNHFPGQIYLCLDHAFIVQDGDKFLK